MLKRIASFLILTLALYTGAPAFAQDFDDLANSGATTQTSRASEILDEIEALLDGLQQDMGGNFTMQVQKNSPEDVQWSGRFESVNIQIKSLWDQFFAAVSQEVEQRQYERDQAFRTAIAEAFQAYRAIFTGAGDGPSVQYNSFVSRAGATNLVLRRDIKFWVDKKVSFNAGVGSVSTGSSSPANWDDGELVYAMGLMPTEMLNDVNKSIQAAYFYGYVNEWYDNDPTAAASKFLFLGVGSFDLAFDATLAETTYYSSIYSSQYLPRLSILFQATTPKAATGGSDQQGMATQVERIEELLAQAEGFAAMVNRREGSSVVTTDKGNMYLHRSVDKATAERIMAEYQQIQTNFKQAMDTFKVYLASYRNNFGGAESLELQRAMRTAYDAYARDFVYSEIDAYGTRYEALETRAGQFKLDRRATFGAADKHISTPRWGQRPRRELYSAQRLITLLPGVMTTKIDEKRRRAYNWGRSNAEAEYRDALNYSYGLEWESSRYSYATEPADSPNGSGQLPGDDLGAGGSGYDTEPGNGSGTDYPDYGTDDGSGTDYPDYGTDDGSGTDYPDYGTDDGSTDTDYPSYGGGDDYDTDGGSDYPSYGGGQDLSGASISDLTAIDGIGDAKATAIYYGGPYASWDELLAVDGIGPSTAQKLSDAGFRIDGQPYR